MILLDVGIHQRVLGLDLSSHLLANDFNAINLYFWDREQRSSHAEVDYLIQTHEKILPIEVKSGTKGQMQSLHLFLKERNLSGGVRVSLENFTSYGSVVTCPLYAVKRLAHLVV